MGMLAATAGPSLLRSPLIKNAIKNDALVCTAPVVCAGRGVVSGMMGIGRALADSACRNGHQHAQCVAPECARRARIPWVDPLTLNKFRRFLYISGGWWGNQRNEVHLGASR